MNLTSKLARLADSSVSDIRDANLWTIVSFGDERTSLKLVTVDADLNDIAAHLWRIELNVMSVISAFNNSARQLTLRRASYRYVYLFPVGILL